MAPDISPMLIAATAAYGLDADALRSCKALAGSEAQHGDLHFKIDIDGSAYSLRLIPRRRYGHDVFVELTDELLAEQMRLCDFLAANNLPFMKRQYPAIDAPFVDFTWAGTDFRLVVFHWITGQHCAVPNTDIALQMGRLARRFHDISLGFDSSILPRTNHVDGYEKWLASIRAQKAYDNLDQEIKRRLDAHLSRGEGHIRDAAIDDFSSRDRIVQFDFNLMNVLWNEQGSVAGVVDFEKCQYSERTQVLAWLINLKSTGSTLAITINHCSAIDYKGKILQTKTP